MTMNYVKIIGVKKQKILFNKLDQIGIFQNKDV